MLFPAVLLIYLSGLLVVGVVKSRQVKTQAGFSLAGRGLGPFVLTGTLLATWTGTGSIFGLAEEGYTVGLPALLVPLSTALGLIVLAFLCTRVRAKGRYTLQDILEERFGPAARVLGTLTLVLAYLVIVSYQLRAAESVLRRTLETSGFLGAGEVSTTSLLVFVAVAIAGYTALAGLMSIALTDTFNGVLMGLGLIIALPVVWSAVGDAPQVLTSSAGPGTTGMVFAPLGALPESARQLGGHYTLFDMLSRTLPLFLLVIGDANLHQRFLAAKSDRAARMAVLFLIPSVLVLDAVIILVAVGGSVLLPGLENAGPIVLELGLSVLPPLLGAVLVAAILAIIVSTADSYLLASSTSLVRDVYQRFVRRNASEAELLKAARIVVGLLALAAVVVALGDDEFFSVALFAYTIYGVGITPPLLAALFWKRATPAGAVTSMVAAVTCAVTWRNLDVGPAAAARLGLPEGSSVDAVVPSVVIAVVLMVVVSLMTTPRAPIEPAT